MKAMMEVGWTWYPSVLIGFAVWTLAYLLAGSWLRRRYNLGDAPTLSQQTAFHAGTIIALIALVSPLDGLGDEYLFSAHMTQHLLLTFIVPPLWLLGIPGWLINYIVPRQLTALAEAFLRPIPAFIIFTTIMFIWHIPSIYEFAQENEGVHIFEHLSFIGSALIGWWPIAGPSSSAFFKPMPPARMFYIFLLAFPCTLLAAILTFAHKPLYPFYVSAPHPFGINVLEDQQIGGLLMWLPTHMILLLSLGITFMSWLKSENSQSGSVSTNPVFRS